LLRAFVALPLFQYQHIQSLQVATNHQKVMMEGALVQAKLVTGEVGGCCH
jgi:hypothetical protein